MIDKNEFLIYNEIIYSLNKCRKLSDLKNQFFSRLRMLIPFSYASILLCDVKEETASVRFHTPICFPDFFTDAENEYIRYADQDNLLWLIHSRESVLIRESDLIGETKRFNSFIYKHCYCKYNIFDTLQYGITYEGKVLGILTLFRTKIDGAFCDEDMFYLRSCGAHLNLLIDHLCKTTTLSYAISDCTMEELRQRFLLTNRETQILLQIFQYCSIDEIAHELGITEHTVQKHLQNLFKKMNVSSRWEILKLYARPHSN